MLKFAAFFPFFWQLLNIFSSYKSVKIIQFPSMVDAFGGFADAVSCYTRFTLLCNVLDKKFPPELKLLKPGCGDEVPESCEKVCGPMVLRRVPRNWPHIL